MKTKLVSFLFVLFCVGVFFPRQAVSQEKEGGLTAKAPEQLTLVHAVMCEKIKEHAPQNQAIVFSIQNGAVCCFTFFDPVPEKTFIYHNWLHRGKPAARIKLFLQPPRWATFSRIELRESDKGPWRVEIIDQKGTLLRAVRFSITD
jgi:hypothetical protein